MLQVVAAAHAIVPQHTRTRTILDNNQTSDIKIDLTGTSVCRYVLVDGQPVSRDESAALTKMTV